MASTERAAAAGAATAVLLSEQSHAARELAAEMAARDGRMDETVPGGRYVVGGRVVDANGNEIAEGKAAAGLPETLDDAAAQLAELDRQRAALLARQSLLSAQQQAAAATSGTAATPGAEELQGMTKAELADVAKARGVDVSGMTKAEMLDALGAGE